jgi:hypothetical protein
VLARRGSAMADIFISYSKSDHALALKLATFLESEGWTVWWDKSLGAADLYRDEIMKQLMAARAVISIWTPNSIRSDWVRAEAGRAKADGKLIPVKTAELTYADIPLPFGEMHTENIGSSELIRAAIVAQLAKPAITPSPFWQITGVFKYQVLTWIGIVGSAITLFANLTGVLNLADWARVPVEHWHDWSQMLWGWMFGWIGIKVPRALVPPLSFIVFTVMLVIGVSQHARRHQSVQSQNAIPGKSKPRILMRGIALYWVPLVVVEFVVGIILVFIILLVPEAPDVLAFILFAPVLAVPIIFPLCYLLYYSNQRSWVVISSMLFLVMSILLLLVPITPLLFGSRERYLEFMIVAVSPMLLLQICWMAVILFSPLQQLTRRLGFVVLGVLTLVVLSEISKLGPASISETRKGVGQFVATSRSDQFMRHPLSLRSGRVSHQTWAAS